MALLQEADMAPEDTVMIGHPDILAGESTQERATMTPGE